MANTLPKDRESLFFLNVLDIPPNCPELEGKNGIKFAMQNRIKFIYRPEGLTGVDKESFRRLSIKHVNGCINIKNNSANWITIPELTGSGKINHETLLLAPWSDKTISTASVISQYTVTLIDDNGNYLSEKVKAVK